MRLAAPFGLMVLHRKAIRSWAVEVVSDDYDHGPYSLEGLPGASSLHKTDRLHDFIAQQRRNPHNTVQKTLRKLSLREIQLAL